MAKSSSIVLEIKYSWYVRNIYLPSLILFSRICSNIGIEINPDWELIEKTVFKGAKLKMKNKYNA